MNQRISLLAGLLVVQLLLAGVLLFGSPEAVRTSELLQLEVGDVTGLTVTDPEGGVVDLTRNPEGWWLGTLPADAGRIAEVIESLTNAPAGWPVATSADSQRRFEVTRDVFQRRVRFQGEGEVLAEVYIGTSPGFRRVHVRREGDEAVYAIDFAVHELPMAESEWLDKSLFQSAEISVVELASGQRLTRDDAGVWLVDGDPADPEAAARYVDRLERLSILGVQAPGAAEPAGEPVSILLQDADGSHTLTFRFDELNDRYLLTSDRIAGTFTVASYIVEQILVDPAELLPEGALESDAPTRGSGAG